MTRDIHEIHDQGDLCESCPYQWTYDEWNPDAGCRFTLRECSIIEKGEDVCPFDESEGEDDE